jgi:hypothetical protein
MRLVRSGGEAAVEAEFHYGRDVAGCAAGDHTTNLLSFPSEALPRMLPAASTWPAVEEV